MKLIIKSLQIILILSVFHTSSVFAASVDEESTVSLGICYGALQVSDPNDQYTKRVNEKIKSSAEKHLKEYGIICAGKHTETCFNKLSKSTRIFINAGSLAIKELKSSGPLSFMKGNMRGNDPFTLGTVKMAHCPSLLD